jgi:Asp-tRNA(Asn)/Glu-tRNA(Gln) amidotransferase A subunit family amidase
MDDLVFLPAHQLARRIRDRKISAVEVLNAYLAQIAKRGKSSEATTSRHTTLKTLSGQRFQKIF